MSTASSVIGVMASVQLKMNFVPITLYYQGMKRELR
jgi:hypothetical protein